MKQSTNQPFTGTSAFAHKGGMHINAIIKNSKAYEHIDPTLVGNKRRFLVSELGGKTGIYLRAKEYDVDLHKENPKTKKILELLQKLEHQGYHFEAAEASFELFLKRALKKFKDYFILEGLRVVVSKESDKKFSSATLPRRYVLRPGGRFNRCLRAYQESSRKTI